MQLSGEHPPDGKASSGLQRYKKTAMKIPPQQSYGVSFNMSFSYEVTISNSTS